MVIQGGNPPGTISFDTRTGAILHTLAAEMENKGA